jgi:hypothetical protein
MVVGRVPAAAAGTDVAVEGAVSRVQVEVRVPSGSRRAA